MTDRLTAQDWIDFALKTLARDGFQALKADVLARRLGVSRGSFYWHFAALGPFHSQVIAHWRQVATEAIIADLEQHAREERIDVLLRRAFAHGNALEIRMRAWADENPEAARALDDVDRRRRNYVERMLVEAGVAPALAATRAELVYWVYLGAALSRGRLTGERLERMVAELKAIALGAGSNDRAAETGRRSARRRG